MLPLQITSLSGKGLKSCIVKMNATLDGSENLFGEKDGAQSYEQRGHVIPPQSPITTLSRDQSNTRNTISRNTSSASGSTTSYVIKRL